MKEFLTLNKHKFPTLLKLSAAIFGGGPLVIFIAAYIVGEPTELSLALTVILGFGIGFPLFILGLSILMGTFEARQEKAIFSKPPFSEVFDLGFVMVNIDVENRWEFASKKPAGDFNGFFIFCSIDHKYDKNYVRFCAQLHYALHDDQAYDQLLSFANEHGYLYDYSNMIMKIHINEHDCFQVGDLTHKLKEFTDLIRSVRP